MKVFNKIESDFPTLLEYNNYLEEVEDIIYSIVNEEENAQECKAKIKAYEEENRSAIVIRQSQRADEDEPFKIGLHLNREKLKEERENFKKKKRQ